MRIPIIVCFFLVLPIWIISQNTEAYTWDNVPIGGGGYITGMKIHPLDATKRYYRTDVGGAYRWDAASGRMEQMIFLDNKNLYSVAGIALHPTNTNIIYLAVGRNCNPSQNAILKSVDAGENFSIVNINGGVPFWFAANGGRECLSGADKDRQGTPIDINPHNPNELYIGTRGQGLYILNLTSLNLNHIPSSSIPYNNSQLSIRSVVFHPTQPLVYIAYPGHGFYVGDTNTLNFSSYGIASHTELQDAIDISISKDANYLLVACKTQGIKKATNLTGTLSWTSLTGLNSADDEGYLTVDCSPHINNVAVTVVADWNHINEFQVTSDGGNNWNQVGGFVTPGNNIFPWRSDAFASHVSQIAFDPNDVNKLFYTSWFSTFSCDNFSLTGSNSWHNLEAKGHEEIVPTDLIAFPTNSQDNFLMAGSGDHSGFLFDQHISHQDSFATFTVADRASTNISPLKKSASMDFCENLPDHLVVCLTDEWTANKGGILTSSDGGLNWDLKIGYDTSMHKKAIVAMSSSDPNNIIALNEDKMMYTTDGNNFAVASGSNTLSSSCTNPFTFTCQGPSDFSGPNINPNVFGAFRNIAGDKNYACVFYSYNWDGSFNISIDGGENWCIINQGTLPITTNIWNKTRLISIPGLAHAGHLWININEQLWHSTDAGANWTNYTSTQSVDKVKALSFGKGFNSIYPAMYIYGSIDAISGDFFYRSDDMGLSWIKINDHAESESWGDNKIIAGDRNVAGRLFATASGQGVVFGDTDDPTCNNAEITIDGEFDDINSSNIPSWTESQINGAMMDGSINNWTKAELDISIPGTNDYDLQLWQDDLSMDANKNYLILTDLRADDDRPVTIKLRNKTTGFTYLERVVDVSSSSQEYAFIFRPTVTDNDLRLTLMVGGNSEKLYIDHVRFRELCPGEVDQIECVEYIYLQNLDIESDLFKASKEIISNGQVSNAAIVDFQATESILLESGWEVFIGSEFSAVISGCP